MNKKIIAVITALALCGVGYAAPKKKAKAPKEEKQAVEAPAIEEEEEAYEEEEEEDEAYEEEEEEAPRKESKPKKPRAPGDPFIGLGFDLISLNHATVVVKLNENMEVSAILGLKKLGETEYETGNNTTKGGDDAMTLSIGAGFDYLLGKFEPTTIEPSIGGELVLDYTSMSANDASNMTINFNILFGVRGELVKNLFLSGKTGLNIDYTSTSATQNVAGKDTETTGSKLDFGFNMETRVYVTWFFM